MTCICQIQSSIHHGQMHAPTCQKRPPSCIIPVRRRQVGTPRARSAAGIFGNLVKRQIPILNVRHPKIRNLNSVFANVVLALGDPRLHRCGKFEARHIPMRRHLAQPRHPGILHRCIGVQAFGDGVGNGGLALFGQQGDEVFLLGNQPVNLRRFAVEEGGDGGLLGDWRKRERNIVDSVLRLGRTC